MMEPIRHIAAPAFPQFRFEWHPSTKRVFIIRQSAPTIGEPIAFEIADHGAAHNAALIWLRGYRAAQAEAALTPKRLSA
jgi:hypothetical protein